MEYFVTQNLNHDCKEYVRGDVVSMSEEQAKKLLADGVLQTEPIAKEATPEPIQAAPAQEEKPQPKAGGKKTKTGEPSIDTEQQDAARTEAKDVTPKTEEPPADDDISANL